MTSARERFGAARVARLATVGDDAVPHLVPVVFALAPDADVIYSCVDHKPKRTRRLRRLANIAANPAVTLLADRYSDDWSALWWVRVDGLADVIDAETTQGAGAIDLLADKYPQYRAERPDGPVIVMRDLVWHEWSARP
ncbi:TIGR03668 family PPOX class F420-dependent oxidoreductase [Gordonia sp. SID5947]|uniref:TIGR03668 family PPOX class F420-dependent oxidoreductase n=1 Tax=Gordonia sp. SID5947 TaxID=2690315 RepID=UPI0013713C0A|nr:TIGR03668 family PPOX class F420-dependent oxidoreductase [Gordonia sp. SID5947]MYR08105.1 TIGR03668 family PPOX class F420-dependent oxidoreductase [Gordonia sp. SID5947]